MKDNSHPQVLSHRPVLYHEIICALDPKSPGRYVDATVGAGGHSRGILEASAPHGELFAMDVDPQALVLARENLAEYGNRATLRQASYTSLKNELIKAGWGQVDGIIADLGFSSVQIDNPERGFSFQADGPLDMRFDPGQEKTAAMLVNTLDEDPLAGILWEYGEERQSRQIARAICRNRPIRSTRELAAIVSKTVHRSNSRIHPATHTFQALRIAVNDELAAIRVFLPQAVESLKPGGRLAVITFHSLEDRIVKHYFFQESRECICPPEQVVCTCDHKASIALLHRRSISAGKEEIATNPRARSARLRIAVKPILA
jgi:16S rRNA (cytosine1402-N4)-methyltransferase